MLEDPAALMDESATLREAALMDNSLVFLERGLPPARGSLSIALFGLRGGAVVELRKELQVLEDLSLRELKEHMVAQQMLTALLASDSASASLLTGGQLRLRLLVGDGSQVHPYMRERILKGERRRLKDKSLGLSGKRVCVEVLAEPEALDTADRVFLLRRLVVVEGSGSSGQLEQAQVHTPLPPG
jgi:hypothetical protein